MLRIESELSLEDNMSSHSDIRASGCGSGEYVREIRLMDAAGYGARSAKISVCSKDNIKCSVVDVEGTCPTLKKKSIRENLTVGIIYPSKRALKKRVEQ